VIIRNGTGKPEFPCMHGDRNAKDAALTKGLQPQSVPEGTTGGEKMVSVTLSTETSS
jgi:hypothetical protein